MSWVVRPARGEDLEELHSLAGLTGAGFTNLPQDHDAMAARLAWSLDSFGKSLDAPENDLYMLVLEEGETGRVGGTALLFAQIGAEWPFYSYKLSRLSQTSRALKRTITTELMYLVNDLNGASEVGGLFLHPELRASGLGRLLARSRYMFIAQHRPRFAERTISELRGWQSAEGESPFWDAIGRLFFNMSFIEADAFNAAHGNQFIADLMPKHPIYNVMLPQSARDAIGRPHDTGRGALKMLEREGFRFSGYVDIFDGGPTVEAPTDAIVTVRDSWAAAVVAPAIGRELPPALMATGRLNDFRCWLGAAERVSEGWVVPEGWGPVVGEEVRCVAF